MLYPPAIESCLGFVMIRDARLSVAVSSEIGISLDRATTFPRCMPKMLPSSDMTSARLFAPRSSLRRGLFSDL